MNCFRMGVAMKKDNVKMGKSLVGKKIRFRSAMDIDVKIKTGTIVWVHPKGRFVVVEYVCLNGIWGSSKAKIRECLLYPSDTGTL